MPNTKATTVPLTATASSTTAVRVDAVRRAVMARVPVAAIATKTARRAVTAHLVKVVLAEKAIVAHVQAAAREGIFVVATVNAALIAKSAVNLRFHCPRSPSR